MQVNTKQLPVGSMRIVANLPWHMQFISDSQDVAPIKEHIGISAIGYDSFFVAITDGDYSEVWGMCGITPRLSTLVSKLL